MGRYEWSYKSPNVGFNYSSPTYISPLTTTHEPPRRLVPRQAGLLGRRHQVEGLKRHPPTEVGG